MSIKSNEQERRAVADHQCPVHGCRSYAGSPCVKLAGRGFVKPRSGIPENRLHPHTQRVDLVREEEKP